MTVEAEVIVMVIRRTVTFIAAVFVFGQSVTSQVNAQPAIELAAKGAWDPAATYAKDDIVTLRGSAWRSKRNDNLNKMPGQTHPSTATSWELFARGLNPLGVWSNATKYQPDDLVTRNGQTWRAKITNIHRQPLANQFWELLAQKGAQGAAGAPGPQGTQGLQGPPGPNTGIGAGTASLPSISFTGDAATGIYSPSAGKIALVENGTLFLHNNGAENTALGGSALGNNTGSQNTALGESALQSNTTGNNNTAMGRRALLSNTTGGQNTALGESALLDNATGSSNTALGASALLNNTTGTSNTALGIGALLNNATGSSNIAIGGTAGLNPTAPANSIFIGNLGVASDTAVIKIGTQGTQASAFMAGIRGVTTTAADAVAVLVSSTGQLGTVSSSRRYKTDIETMADTSAMLAKLRPVTFRYKQPQDGAHPLQYGLIAEEVAHVFPDLAVFNKDGSAETVKYHLLPNFLLAGWQAQQNTIATLRDEVRQQKEVNASLEARLATLEAVFSQKRAALRR
jgi:hypothetical protein